MREIDKWIWNEKKGIVLENEWCWYKKEVYRGLIWLSTSIDCFQLVENYLASYEEEEGRIIQSTFSVLAERKNVSLTCKESKDNGHTFFLFFIERRYSLVDSS